MPCTSMIVHQPIRECDGHCFGLAGPGGLLGAAEGLSYLTLAAGAVVLALQVSLLLYASSCESCQNQKKPLLAVAPWPCSRRRAVACHLDSVVMLSGLASVYPLHELCAPLCLQCGRELSQHFCGAGEELWVRAISPAGRQVLWG